MYKRLLNIESLLDEGLFLFGPRQSGKSTLLTERFPDALYIDLLKTDVYRRYKKNPALLREFLKNKEEGTLIIIDEIPKVPELLDEVHWLMVNKNLRFILSGSSARKLRRGGENTLGGRANLCTLYPLVSAEIPDFDIMRAIQNGMLPRHYQVENAVNRLQGYIDVYLKEEIKQEALVRNLDGFNRFMEVAAITDGEMINYQNIASDCGVSANTIKEYFTILKDTLIGNLIPAYTKVMKRKLVQAPKFYYFDVGIVNYLLGRNSLAQGTTEFGHAFEHLVIQEIIAYLNYSHSRESLSYWRTYSGLEVDAIIGEARVAIEIKSTDEIQTKHLKGLNAFSQEHPSSKLMVVSFDVITRDIGSIKCLYVNDFLKLLWNNQI